MKTLWRSFSVMRAREVSPMSREPLPGSAGERCPPVMRGWCSGFCCGRRCPVWGSCPGWRSTAGYLCRWTIPFGKGRIAPLNGLCGAVCPPWGWGKVSCPIWACQTDLGCCGGKMGTPAKPSAAGLLGRGGAGESPDAVARQGSYNLPQCGRFSGIGADAFSPLQRRP